MNVYLWICDDTQAANGWAALGWYNNVRGPTDHGVRTTTGEEQVKALLEGWAAAGYKGWWCTQDDQRGAPVQGRYETKPFDDYAAYQPDPVQQIRPDGTSGPWLV